MAIVWEAAVADCIVISLPETPFTLNPVVAVVIVVVVPAVNSSTRALEASEKFIWAKVFEPVIVSFPVFPATVIVRVP